MQSRLSAFMIRYPKLIPLFLFLLFLAVSIPGVNWGVPALWNPDELVWRVVQAVDGQMQFDETEPDFNYPSLPKYVMFGIGKAVTALGYGDAELIISARVFSALLGGLSILLIYALARMMSNNIAVAALAGLLGISSAVISANARFAHNDMYLLFFTVLCIYFLVRYQYTKDRLWLYGSFLAVGLAASSKYTGGSLILIPILVLVVLNGQEARRNLLQSFEMLFIGGALSFLGYVAGTPKALLWMAFYFKRVIPALGRYPLYGLQPNSVIGLVGQWRVFEDAVGTFAFFLFIICFIWFTVKLILQRFGKTQMEEKRAHAITILLATLIVFDLPFMVSVNYIPRYFIPFVPFLSILAALFLKEIFDLAAKKSWKYAPAAIVILLALGISYSFLRLVSAALLFTNDARIPASDYIAALRGENTVIEYTLYPPIVDKTQFYKAHNYPIFFLKYPGETMPTGGGKLEYNQGEQGLIDRAVNYLVIDTFTYLRLNDPYTCDSNPLECDFFKKLLAGETRYRLLKEFKYALPPYLPQVYISAVNPEIRIYEHVP